MIQLKILLLILSSSALAQSIESYTKNIILKTDSKKIAQEMALNTISQELIIGFLGKKDYQKQRLQIKKHIIKNKNRYVVSIDSSSGKMDETGKFSFVVNIKISKDNLVALLKEHSFLKSSQSSYCILPLISFSSYFGTKKQTWSWWTKKDSSRSHLFDMKQANQFFFNSLGKEFTKIGFYFIDPVFQQTTQAVPSSILPRKGNKMKYFNPIIHFYSCDIILSGLIHLEKGVDKSFLYSSGDSLNTAYWVQFSIRAFNRKTKENLFELNRKFPIKKGSGQSLQEKMDLKSKEMIESLIYRFSFYQERGSLGLDRLIIALQGNLTYPQKEKLINQIVQKVDDLKNIQIIYLSSQRAVYRAEVSKTLNQILKELKGLSLKTFVLQVRKIEDSKLEIYAKTKKTF